MNSIENAHVTIINLLTYLLLTYLLTYLPEEALHGGVIAGNVLGIVTSRGRLLPRPKVKEIKDSNK